LHPASPHTTPSRRRLAVPLRPPRPRATYTLPLHDALPIWCRAGPDEHLAPSGAHLTRSQDRLARVRLDGLDGVQLHPLAPPGGRSEEHTSELQSRENLVCRLLLEKKTRRRGRRRPG